MLDWPAQIQTSPTSTSCSSTVCCLPAILTLYGPPSAGGCIRVSHLPTAPAVAVAEFSPISTRNGSPGCDHPQIAFGLQRCRTMLSPKIGLTNGRGVAAWGGAPRALPPATAPASRQGMMALVNFTFMFLILIHGNH